MFNDIFRSIGAYFKGIPLIAKHNLWSYMIIPGIISLLYAGLLVWVGSIFDDKLAEWAVSWVPWNWLKSILSAVISGAFWIFVYFFSSVTYRFFVLIILSPFLTVLSAKVEKAVTGRDTEEAGFGRFFYDIWRAIVLGIRNLVIELFLTFFMFFIPILNPVGIYIVQSTYAGFGLIDYSLERKLFSISQSVSFMRRHRGLCIGLGIGFQVLMLIPVVGWFLAPTLGAIAGTLRVLDVEDNMVGELDKSPESPSNDTGEVEEIEIKFD